MSAKDIKNDELLLKSGGVRLPSASKTAMIICAGKQGAWRSSGVFVQFINA